VPKSTLISQYLSYLLAGWRLATSCLLALSLFISVTLYGADTLPENTESNAHALLVKMKESTESLTYQGTLVYTQGSRMETLEIFHTSKEGEQSERLVHLTGTPREIIRRGDKVICVHPKNGVIELDNTIPAGPFARNYQARLDSANKPYTVNIAGYTRVAGREVTMLAVQPKDDYRYGFKLALDNETSLLLQSLMVDANNKVLERFEYTEIKIGGEISAEQLAPHLDRSHERLSLLDQKTTQSLAVTDPSKLDKLASQALGEQNWQVGWLPAGFTLSTIHFEQKPVGDTKYGKSNSKMYSDGLSTFSVFITPDVDMSKVLSVQSGATLAYSLVKRDAEGLYSITVVGEIPPKAAKGIATSVSRLASR
jgi:sigma-E factor negative regulatory protein RseB